MPEKRAATDDDEQIEREKKRRKKNEEEVDQETKASKAEKEFKDKLVEEINSTSLLNKGNLNHRVLFELLKEKIERKTSDEKIKIIQQYCTFKKNGFHFIFKEAENKFYKKLCQVQLGKKNYPITFKLMVSKSQETATSTGYFKENKIIPDETIYAALEKKIRKNSHKGIKFEKGQIKLTPLLQFLSDKKLNIEMISWTPLESEDISALFSDFSLFSLEQLKQLKPLLKTSFKLKPVIEGAIKARSEKSKSQSMEVRPTFPSSPIGHQLIAQPFSLNPPLIFPNSPIGNKQAFPNSIGPSTVIYSSLSPRQLIFENSQKPSNKERISSFQNFLKIKLSEINNTPKLSQEFKQKIALLQSELDEFLKLPEESSEYESLEKQLLRQISELQQELDNSIQIYNEMKTRIANKKITKEMESVNFTCNFWSNIENNFKEFRTKNPLTFFSSPPYSAQLKTILSKIKLGQELLSLEKQEKLVREINSIINHFQTLPKESLESKKETVLEQNTIQELEKMIKQIKINNKCLSEEEQKQLFEQIINKIEREVVGEVHKADNFKTNYNF